MEESTIRLGSIGIGTVRLDPAEVKGEGGEYDPRLVIPIQIELNQQPKERQIVILRLSASLHLDHATGHSDQFASKVSYELTNEMAIASIYGAPNRCGIDLCFSLTHAQLKALENRRHDPGKNLYLRLEPIIAWNKHTGNADDRPYGGGSTLQEGGWDISAGMFSDFAFFWLPKVEKLRLDLTKMDWVKSIFPGMGYNNFRLIEVKLPLSNVLIPAEAVDHFKQAKEDYDRGAYDPCIGHCRFVLDAIEQHLSPRPQGHALGGSITTILGWPSTPTLTAQARFLDNAWLGLYIMANAAHHLPSTKSLLPADAHMVLISTAAMLEYLAQLE